MPRVVDSTDKLPLLMHARVEQGCHSRQRGILTRGAARVCAAPHIAHEGVPRCPEETHVRIQALSVLAHARE